MITLHHLEKSRSFRILWLLEELKLAYGLDYQLVSYPRNHKTYLAPVELKQLHTMGKAPILIDDTLPQGEQALAESALIIEYLLKTYDKEQLFYPKTEKTWREYTFWLHFAEGSLMPPLVMSLILSKATQKVPFFAKPIANKLKDGIGSMILNGNINSALELVEQTLSKQPWFAGESLTGADIQMYFAVAAARERVGLPKHYHATQQWLQRCEQCVGFKNAIAVAGSVF